MRAIPFVAFFLSGASSLIFQTIWTRMLHHVFGSTSVAISSVLTVFMGGLGLGAWVFGRYADRIKHPLLLYALAEVGVAACALLIPLLVQPEGWLADVNAYLRASLGAESIGFAVARFFCVVPILIIPTTLMGATLPLLARHFVRSQDDSGSATVRTGTLYAINTFGAVAGTLLAGFLLLPSVGLSWTNYVALGINLLLALLIWTARKWLLAHREEREAAEPSPSPPAPRPLADAPTPTGQNAPDLSLSSPAGSSPLIRRLALIAFMISGATALCYEVVWSRALAMVIGSSIYSFTLILTTFLIGIASGSAAASSFLERPHPPLGPVAVAGAVLCLLAPLSAAVDGGVIRWLLFSGCAIGVVSLFYFAGSRWRRLAPERPSGTLWAIAIVSVPTVTAALCVVASATKLAAITTSVVAAISVFVTLLITLRRRPIALLAAVQVFIAAATFVSYLWQDEIPIAFTGLVGSIQEVHHSVGTVQLMMFVVCGLCTLPATLGMGAMFPLTMRAWSSGGASVGRDIGAVYTGNTLGSLVGAWLPGFLLLPLIGMERTLQAGIVTNLLCGVGILVVVHLRERGLLRRVMLAGMIPILLIALGATFLWVSLKPQGPLRWNLSKMTLGVFRLSSWSPGTSLDDKAKIVYYRDGLSTTVSVELDDGAYSMKNNGKVDASTGDDMDTQILLGTLPFLVHPRPTGPLDLAVVGFGSGVTVGSALRFPVRSVEVIELEPTVLEASRFFERVNHLKYPLQDYPWVQVPRLKVIADDGRNYLASARKQYDIIISEPSNPWITGVSDLFTRDHFQIARKRLKPDGVFCQWVQLYELSPVSIKVIYRTVASQFRYVKIFATQTGGTDTLILASDQPLKFDVRRLRRVWSLPGVAAEFKRASVSGPFEALGLLIFSSPAEVMQFAQTEFRRKPGGWVAKPGSTNQSPCPPQSCRREPVPINTDDNAWIEFAAPKDLISQARWQDYANVFYDDSWPYGRIRPELVALGADPSPERAATLVQLALSLIACGRLGEARALLRESRDVTSLDSRLARRLIDEFTSTPDPPLRADVSDSPLYSDPEGARALNRVVQAVNPLIEMAKFDLAFDVLTKVLSDAEIERDPVLLLVAGYLSYQVGVMRESEDMLAVAGYLLAKAAAHPVVEAKYPEVYYFQALALQLMGRSRAASRHMTKYALAMIRREGTKTAWEPKGAKGPKKTRVD